MIKGDKRTKVNFSDSPSSIDFLIPGSQKKTGANHVKSRQQLTSKPKTVRHFYPTIRKRTLNYNNKPFSSINPHFLAAKVIKPKNRAKSEPTFVENFDFSSRQQSNKTKLSKKMKKKVSISSPIRNRFEKNSGARTINVVHTPESGANSRNRSKLNSRNESFIIGHSPKPAKKDVITTLNPINQRKLKKYDQEDFYQKTVLKVPDVDTSVVKKRQGFVSEYDVLTKSRRLTLTKATKPRAVYRNKSPKKGDNVPVFEFETNISVSLDSNGYLLTIILISQIIIFGMVLYSRSLNDKSNNSLNE